MKNKDLKEVYLTSSESESKIRNNKLEEQEALYAKLDWQNCLDSTKNELKEREEFLANPSNYYVDFWKYKEKFV